MTRPDLDALLRFVHDASTVDREAAVVPELIAQLERLVPGAEQVLYCVLDREHRRVAFYVDASTVACDLDGDAVYWELRDQHAVCDHFERTGDGRPRMMSDLLRPREWRARELYNVSYAPFQYELDLRLPVEPGYRYTKTFIFLSSRRDFTERDRLVLELLYPHLRRIDQTFARQPQLTANVPLTRREREILAWVERGSTNAQIAEALFIAPGTVKKHLDNVYAKLGVGTRTAAVTRLRASWLARGAIAR